MSNLADVCIPYFERGYGNVLGCRLLPVTPCKQAQKFTPRTGIGLERTEHGTGGGVGILFFYTAHGHAQMERIDHHGHALRFQNIVQAVGNL